MIRYTYLSS
jgi:hypothetical protein